MLIDLAVMTAPRKSTVTAVDAPHAVQARSRPRTKDPVNAVPSLETTGTRLVVSLRALIVEPALNQMQLNRAARDARMLVRA